MPGDRTATTQAAIDAVSATGAMYASHIYDPYFLQGTKTYAFELWEQLDAGPDALILPVGNGTLLLGAARGFRELHAAGLMRPRAGADRRPERALRAARAGVGRRRETSLRRSRRGRPSAEGIAIPRPPRGAQILAAVRASGGCIVEVPEEAVGPGAGRAWPAAGCSSSRPRRSRGARRCWRAATRRSRTSTRPATAWARARELASGSVVVPLCGSGLKSK